MTTHTTDTLSHKEAVDLYNSAAAQCAELLERLSESTHRFEKERAGLLKLKDAQSRAIKGHMAAYNILVDNYDALAEEHKRAMQRGTELETERNSAVENWVNVWHMLEAEPSYQQREQEAEIANQVWHLQHPEATYAAAGSSVALARDNR